MREKTPIKYLVKKYLAYIYIYKKIPKMFNPYNESEITDLAPTLTCHCGSWSSSATVLILEEEENGDKKV